MAMGAAQCFLKEIDLNSCGPSRDIKGLVLLYDCSDDIFRHLASFRPSKLNLNKCDLILAKVGIFDVALQEKDQFLVCPYHRHKYGKFWRPSKVTCQYPLHKGESKTLKGTAVVTLQMAKDIHTLYRSAIPVGSCK